MICIVASYSPLGSCERPHLGAARKIELVVRVLSRLDKDLVLVNSAHNDLTWSAPVVRSTTVGGVNVREFLPRRWGLRRLGKLLNLFEAPNLARQLATQGNLRLLWLYNGYAFESRFAYALREIKACPAVLEFEDWHFARWRGLNPKPWIDLLSWRRALSVIDYGFCVNDHLLRRLHERDIPSWLLPGLIPVELVLCSSKRLPFSDSNTISIIGYFGGLSSEKGADVLLEMAPRLPEGWRLLITGSGPLEGAFRRAATEFPHKLQFLGKVTDLVLYDTIARCDVIVNPHKAIAMSDGVFPFKVVEAIAAGRLLITTELPKLSILGLLEGSITYDGSAAGLVEKLSTARQWFIAKGAAIQTARMIAIAEFGEDALLHKISGFIKHQPK